MSTIEFRALNDSQRNDLKIEFLEKLLGPTFMIVVGGGAGSGKSTVAEEIAAHSNAVHLRNNSVRQRLRELGLSYGTNVSAVIEVVARQLLAQSRSVVIDGTALRRSQRETMQKLATDYGAPAFFIAVKCDVEVAQARDKERPTISTFEEWRPDDAEKYRAEDIPQTAMSLRANLTDVPDDLDGVLRINNNLGKHDLYKQVGIVWRTILTRLQQ